MATNETRLRGKPLTGSEQREAADHVEDDSESLADTHGQRGTGG